MNNFSQRKFPYSKGHFSTCCFQEATNPALGNQTKAAAGEPFIFFFKRVISRKGQLHSSSRILRTEVL